MTTELTKLDSQALEAMVDRSGLEDFLTTVSMICADKAGHMAISLQDTTTAKQWSALATRLGLLALNARGL